MRHEIAEGVRFITGVRWLLITLACYAQFDAGLGLHGHLVVGGPEEVAEKILFQHGVFGHDR